LYQYKSQEAKMPQSRAPSRTTTLPFPTGTSLVRRLRLALHLAAARRRDRKALAQLDAHLLRDIGLTPDEAYVETVKPFWQR
jgi:uncharacterized protein YjiS (DUF1127 family)